MIKLTDLIKEEKTFKAKSKETGRTVVYKSKDAMDKAIKDKRAEPLDKKKTTTKGASLFKKDVQKKKTDTNVKVFGDDGKEATMSPGDQKIVNKHKKTLEITDKNSQAEFKFNTALTRDYSKEEQIKLYNEWLKSTQKMKDEGLLDRFSEDEIKEFDETVKSVHPDELDKLSPEEREERLEKVFDTYGNTKLTKKIDKDTEDELNTAGYSEFNGTYFKREPKPSKEVPKVSNVKVSKEDVKSVSDLANKIEKNIDKAYGDLDSDERDDFAITLQNVGTFLEDSVDYDNLSQEDRNEFDEIFSEVEEQSNHLQNDELGMGSIEGDPRTTSKRAVKFINKFSTKNEGVIKLTDLIKENKRKDLLKVSTTIGRRPSDVNKFLKKYKLDADDLLDVLDAGSSSQRRRYSMAILAAMKGNRRALRALDNLLGFL